MRRTLNVIASLVIVIGIIMCALALYVGAMLHSNGLSGSALQELTASRSATIDKTEKMINALNGSIQKWDETDGEWVSRADTLYTAAADTLEDMRDGGSCDRWTLALEEWNNAVKALNETEDADSAAVKKSVKGLNRQIKAVDGAMEQWRESYELTANLSFNPNNPLIALCIRARLALIYIGVFLIIAGVFIYPDVRRVISESPQAVGYLFVIPALSFLLLFVAYPMIYNIILSMKDVDITNINFPEKQSFVGFKNFRTLFTDVDHQMLGSIKNTLVFTVGSIFFQFVIGFMLALLFRNKFKGCTSIRGAIMISWLIPVTVSGLLFKFMFGMNGGIINQFLGVFGIAPIEWLYSTKYAMPAVIIANIWIGIPFNMVLLLTGLTTIPNEIYESAEIDGARGLKRLFSITIPMIKPAIMSVLTLGFVYTFKVFDLVKVMTSGGPVNSTQLVSIYAYKLAFEKYEYSLGAAAGTIMLIILLIEGLFYIKAIKEDEVM